MPCGRFHYYRQTHHSAHASLIRSTILWDLLERSRWFMCLTSKTSRTSRRQDVQAAQRQGDRIDENDQNAGNGLKVHSNFYSHNGDPISTINLALAGYLSYSEAAIAQYQHIQLQLQWHRMYGPTPSFCSWLSVCQVCVSSMNEMGRQDHQTKGLRGDKNYT